MSIDKIYIINLVHCTDRKARIENQLKLANVTNYEIFNGIVPNLDMLNTFPNFCKTSPEHERLNMLGCLLRMFCRKHHRQLILRQTYLEIKRYKHFFDY